MKHLINICFLFILFGISINHLFSLVDKKSSGENRKLAEKPKLRMRKIKSYPADFDAYINDHLKGRHYFVDWYLWLSNHVYHKKTLNNKYLLGVENHIFELKKNLPAFLGEKTVTENQLKKIGIEFTQRQKYFDSLGIKLYIQIIPCKYKIYSDKLPLLMHEGANNMGTRMVNYFRKNTTIPIIYEYQSLVDKSKNENLYLKYDTHWNTLGSFYSHTALIDSIRKDFPDLRPLLKEDFIIEPYDKQKGNMKWIAPDKSDPDFGYHIKPKNKTFYRAKGKTFKNTGGKRVNDATFFKRYKSARTLGPKVIYVRDSYGNFTETYLPEMFPEIIYLWDDWKYTFNKEIVDYEKPDAVIYSIFETYVDRLLMAPSFVEPENKDADVQ